MLYITLMCIAYILGIIWGLFLTKVGYSPFSFLIIAILYFFKMNPQFNSPKAIKCILLIGLLVIGFFNCLGKINKFENEFQNKSVINCSGYIDRKLSNNKFIFVNEYNQKFIVFKTNDSEINEDLKVNLLGRFLKPSHARNHNRI